MSYWRTLFNRQTKPSKPYFPVTPIAPPVVIATTVTISQSPPPAGAALIFNAISNSQYVPVISF